MASLPRSRCESKGSPRKGAISVRTSDTKPLCPRPGMRFSLYGGGEEGNMEKRGGFPDVVREVTPGRGLPGVRPGGRGGKCELSTSVGKVLLLHSSHRIYHPPRACPPRDRQGERSLVAAASPDRGGLACRRNEQRR